MKNLLQFGSNTDADLAVDKLNQTKKYFIDKINNKLNSLDDYYTTAQTNAILTNYYTSAQTDVLLNDLVISAQTNLTAYYTSAQTNEILHNYVLTSYTYSLSSMTDILFNNISYQDILMYSANTWVNYSLSSIINNAYVRVSGDTMVGTLYINSPGYALIITGDTLMNGSLISQSSATFKTLKIDNNINGVPVVQVGNVNPFYVSMNWPTLSFNAYWDGGWKYGAGSDNQYGGFQSIDPNSGEMNYYLTASPGNADDPAPLIEVLAFYPDGLVHAYGKMLVDGTLTASTFYGNLDWNYLINTPTTLSGYSISDAYTTANTYSQSQVNDILDNYSLTSHTQSTATITNLSVYNQFTNYYTTAQTDTLFSTLDPVINLSGDTSYTATTYGYYFIDTSVGNVNIYIPDSNSANTNKKISIRKQSINDENFIYMSTMSGQKFNQDVTQYSIYKTEHGYTLLSNNGFWETIIDDRTGKYKITVGSENSDFLTIQDSIEWANLYVTVPVEILVKTGTYYIDDTINITNSYITSINGEGYFQTIIHPTITLTGKTMFNITTQTPISNVFIDGSNLGSGTNSYRNTPGSLIVNYTNNTGKNYFDNIRVEYAYNVFNFPVQSGTIKLTNTTIQNIGGDAITMDDGCYVITLGLSIRFCAGSTFNIKNSTSNPTPTSLFSQASRYYGSSTNYSNNIITASNYSSIYLSDCYIQYAQTGIIAEGHANIEMISSFIGDITGYYFDQVDTTAIINITNVLGKFGTTNINITNPNNVNIFGIDKDNLKWIIGNTNTEENKIFDINIGQDTHNPTLKYDTLFDDRGLVYENYDQSTTDPSNFYSVTYNRGSELYVASVGNQAHSKEIKIGLISYQNDNPPKPESMVWEDFHAWEFLKGDNESVDLSEDLKIQYVIGESGITTFLFKTTGDLVIPTNLYITGLTLALPNNALTIDGDNKIIDSGYNLNYLQSSAHTHENKSYLDNINQELSSSSSPTFIDGYFNGGKIQLGTGITLKESGTTLFVRDGQDINYGNMVVNNLTVLGTQTIQNTENISTSGNTITLIDGASGTPTQNAYIVIDRGDEINADIVWDENNHTWKFGLIGSEVPFANDNNVVHITGDEYIAGNKNFIDKIIIGTGITHGYKLQVNFISNLQSSALPPSLTPGAFFASVSGRTYFLGNTKVSASYGKINPIGELTDYWTLANFDDNKFHFKYGTDINTYGHPDMMVIDTVGKVNISNGVQTNYIQANLSNSGFSINDTSDNIILSMSDTYKNININDNVPFNSFNANSILLNGSGLIYTSGLSTLVYSLNNELASVTVDTYIIVNGLNIYVAEILDSNNIIINIPVDLSEGHTWKYKHPSTVSVNGSNYVAKKFMWMQDGNPVWDWDTWYEENSEFIYLYNYRTFNTNLVIHQRGRMGINLPTNNVGQTIPPNVLSIHPQAFDGVYYTTDNINFTDNTTVASSSQLGNFLFLSGTTDYTYLGRYAPWGSILLYITNSITGADIKFEYWNGSSWITLTSILHNFVDNSNNLNTPNNATFDLDSLTTWSPKTINNTYLYYIRVSATSLPIPSYMFSISPNAIDRIGVYSAPHDTMSSFKVDFFGHTGIGNLLTQKRLTTGTVSNIGRSLGIIDDNATVRIWQYISTGATADNLIELIKGNSDTLSNNLWYDIRLENTDPIYGQQGLIFRNVNTNHDQLIISNAVTNINQLIAPIYVTLTGNTIKKGLLLELFELNETNTNNEFTFLSVKNNVSGVTSILNGISICSGLTYGINSKSKIYTTQQFISSISTGTSPIVVTSTTMVQNLNVNYLNGYSYDNFSFTSHTHTITSITDLSSYNGFVNYYTTANTYTINQVNTLLTGYTSLSIYNTFTGVTAPSLYTSSSAYNTYTGITAPALYSTWTAFNNLTANTYTTTQIDTKLSGYTTNDIYNTYTGVTAPSTYTLLSSYNTYTGITAPGFYSTLTAFNNLTANTYTISQINNLLLGYYTTAQTYTSTQIDTKLTGYTTIVSFNNLTATTYTINQVNNLLTGYTITTIYNTYTGVTAPGLYTTLTSFNNLTANTYTISQVNNLLLGYYTTSQTNNLLLGYYTTANTYNQSQVNNLLLGYYTTANTYNQSQVNNLLLGYYTTAQTYTSTQIDTKLTGYTTLVLFNNLTANTYTISQINNLLLGYYTTAQTYTSTQIDTKLTGYTTTTIYNTYTGVTAPGFYMTLSVFNTFTGVTVPSTYVTNSTYNSFTANTYSISQVNNLLLGYYTTAQTYTISQVNNLLTGYTTLVAFNNFTGVTAPTTYHTISAFNTFTGVTLPANYTTLVAFNNLTATTYTQSQVNNLLLGYYTTANTYNQSQVNNLLTGYTSLNSFNTYTGVTIPSNYLTISTYNTYTGITAPLAFASHTAFNTYTGVTVPNTYVTQTVFNNFTGTTGFVTTSSYNTYTGVTAPLAFAPHTAFDTYTASTVANAYGEMYEVNGTGTVVAVSSAAWTGWVTSSAGALLLNTYNTNATAYRLTIASGGAGTYMVNVTCSVISNNTTPVYSMGVYKNNSLITHLQTSWFYSNTGQRYSVCVSGIVTGVAISDFFDLRFTSNNGTSRNLTIYTTSFSINRIGY